MMTNEKLHERYAQLCDDLRSNAAVAAADFRWVSCGLFHASVAAIEALVAEVAELSEPGDPEVAPPLSPPVEGERPKGKRGRPPKAREEGVLPPAAAGEPMFVAAPPPDLLVAGALALADAVIAGAEANAAVTTGEGS